MQSESSSIVIAEALSAYQHVLRLPVLWNDMDAMRHVNNTVYFRYLESGRLDFLSHVKNEIATPGLDGDDDSIALAEVRCRFKAPLTYPDEIVIGSAIKEIGDHHFVIQQEIYSPKLGFVAAEGDGRMVYYDYVKQRKKVIDGDFRAALEAHLVD